MYITASSYEIDITFIFTYTVYMHNQITVDPTKYKA